MPVNSSTKSNVYIELFRQFLESNSIQSTVSCIESSYDCIITLRYFSGSVEEYVQYVSYMDVIYASDIPEKVAVEVDGIDIMDPNVDIEKVLEPIFRVLKNRVRRHKMWEEYRRNAGTGYG